MRACVVRGVIGFARMRRFVSVRNGAGVHPSSSVGRALAF
ncbi:hypothetical protein PF004_g32252 [Phytophthora fragariae]|uniref:Uncharacterized protein n=1 Tax=Phytophthora fragariae TaxID=53985 RepID=A0A6G0M7F7_9STRA|nr:hypothetical protein PF004_g32252 [Phytophthora fragariae]